MPRLLKFEKIYLFLRAIILILKSFRFFVIHANFN